MYGNYGNYGNRGGGRREGGSGGYSDFNSTAPVKVGDEFDVKIEAVGEKGDGIAKKQNFVIFVPGVKEGDMIRVRVTKVLRKVGFGEKIGDAQGPVEESKPRSQPTMAHSDLSVAEVMQPESKPEDTENFGEESSEVQSEESDDTSDENPEEESPSMDDEEQQ